MSFYEDDASDAECVLLVIIEHQLVNQMSRGEWRGTRREMDEKRCFITGSHKRVSRREEMGKERQ